MKTSQVLAGLLCIPFFSGAAYGQISIQSTPVQMYTACFNYAIDKNLVVKEGEKIRFSCAGGVARVFYDALGKSGVPTKRQEYSGQTFDVRYTSTAGDDNCRELLENQGESTQAFDCWLYFYAGPFINR